MKVVRVNVNGAFKGFRLKIGTRRIAKMSSIWRFWYLVFTFFSLLAFFNAWAVPMYDEDSGAFWPTMLFFWVAVCVYTGDVAIINYQTYKANLYYES